ncbi:MAG TPA: peptide chain release factor N(5)-glutamine methyltransferase [Acidimicrobiia bacterium]|nr:peptide chain release factor N(5)-glutamine methyltransferase [Acidimicrobiia bacterium]
MNWRELRKAAARELADAGIAPAETEARFIVERASGYEPAEWLDIAESVPPARAEREVREMLRRRVSGEPLQYVLGGWAFRGLDLFVDPRVLIPRPETEYVVEIALEEAARSGLRRSRRRLSLVETRAPVTAVDIGTGSGAIAIALAAELPDVEVWATDVSEDALAVARANVAGCAATRVRVADAGDWFDPLPPELRGAVRLVVSNPPYVAEHEVADLPDEVAGYEPRGALVSGPSGTEAIVQLLQLAQDWLAPDSTFVCEIAPHQAGAMSEYARTLAYSDVLVRDDLTGRARVIVARTE